MKKRMTTAAAFLVLLAAMVACDQGDAAKVTLGRDGSGEPAPAPAREAQPESSDGDVATVRAARQESTYKAIGGFYAKEEVTISNTVAGTLLSIAVDTGDPVGPKTTVAQFDTVDFDLALRGAKAQLAVAEANLNNARNEYRRKKQLLEEEAITQSTFELVETQLELAEAQIESAEVAVDVAAASLGKTTVLAGVRGVVSTRLASAGEYLKSGTAMVVVSVLKPIELRFSVPERLAALICEGDRVTARLAAYPGREFTGVITLVSPTADPATRTIPIEALFDNGDGALKPGYFADCRVTLCGRSTHFIVPQEALFEGEDGFEVRVQTDDGLRAVPVAVVESQGSNRKIACLDEGALQGGEQVLLKARSGER
jgi:RND family efflux transporter MFP subunit